MDLFVVKKVFGLALMPISIIGILLLLAIVCFKIRPSLSFKCLLSASLILVICSLGVVADQLMSPLEKHFTSYRPHLEQSADFNDMPEKQTVDYIVVLGCGHQTDNALPATAQLYTCSLQRLVEAVRIADIHPEAEVITSGAALSDSVSNAVKVKQAAVLLGIPANKIITENFPKDTEEEAELIAPRVQGKTVILITNADHMYRAVNYFKTRGINVIPAPASFFTTSSGQQRKWSYYLLPQVHYFMQSSRAWYEYLGLTVQWLKTL